MEETTVATKVSKSELSERLDAHMKEAPYSGAGVLRGLPPSLPLAALAADFLGDDVLDIIPIIFPTPHLHILQVSTWERKTFMSHAPSASLIPRATGSVPQKRVILTSTAVGPTSWSGTHDLLRRESRHSCPPLLQRANPESSSSRTDALGRQRRTRTGASHAPDTNLFVAPAPVLAQQQKRWPPPL